MDNANEYTWHSGHVPENVEMSHEYLVFFITPDGMGSGCFYREVLFWDGENKCWDHIEPEWIIVATLKIPRLHQITFEAGVE